MWVDKDLTLRDIRQRISNGSLYFPNSCLRRSASPAKSPSCLLDIAFGLGGRKAKKYELCSLFFWGWPL